MHNVILNFSIRHILLVLLVFSQGSGLALGAPDPKDSEVITLEPAEGGNIRFALRLPEPKSKIRMELLSGLSEKRTGPGVALELKPVSKRSMVRVRHLVRAPNEKKWTELGATNLMLWPEEGNRRHLGVGDVTPRTLESSVLSGLVRYDSKTVRIWIEGKLVATDSLAGIAKPQLVVKFTHDAEARVVANSTGSAETRFERLELSHLMKPAQSFEKKVIDGIPFDLPTDKDTVLSLEQAGWPEAGADPSFTSESYDGDGYFVSDLRMPMMQVPKADYLAAYLLVQADEDPQKGNFVTLRVGRRKPGSKIDSQVRMFDYGAEVGRTPENAGPTVLKIPFDSAASQFVEGDIFDIEITKEIRLARHQPDPNRFRWRPLGLHSGVKIVAVTLERSPVQMVVAPTSAGSLFVSPEKPAFSVTLENITGEEQPYSVAFLSDNQELGKISGRLAPHAKTTEPVIFDALEPGYFPLSVELRQNEAQSPLLTFETTFGVLPQDQRKHRKSAPWGTWDFTGRHFTPTNADLVGNIMRKLGLQYGMFGNTSEERAKYGVIRGNPFRVNMKVKNPQDAARLFEELKEKHSDLPLEMYIFHEDSISGPHVTRIPDIFHDRPAYKLSEDEQARFDTMWQLAEQSAKVMREKYPEVKIGLGNGPMPLREEFYRNKFPSELFDAAGNENATFGRIPETQPPDVIANNASLWMDRQLLDHYGYKDKAVNQAHETIYPSSNPGNLSYRSQADYFIRNILHSMAWGMPQIRPGVVADVGNSYYHSNWGGSGFMNRRPQVSPKPAALAMATLTSALDGAKYEGFEDTGSDSTYLLRFSLEDGGQVLPFWVVRGQRELELEVDGPKSLAILSPFGRETTITPTDGVYRLTATPSPAYLKLPAGTTIRRVSLGVPTYPEDGPKGKVSQLDALDSLEGWNVVSEKNRLLEYYNPLTPRRLGDFRFEVRPPNNTETKASIQVTPQVISHGKETMPMYAELAHKDGIPLPGEPTELGLWVDGNSGWGRIIFELEDASGQQWTSIGAKAKGKSEWMADWMGKELADSFEPGEIADWNTDDAWGLSRINFDGWHYVGFPLPGQYPGENYPWAANSQWRSDKDGIVHYPLTLKKIIVEMPEKVLHLTRFAPPKTPSIFLRDLLCVQSDLNGPKLEAQDYVEKVQNTID